MKKIATPQDLTVELRRLQAYAESDSPSREKLAEELHALADQVSRTAAGTPKDLRTLEWTTKMLVDATLDARLKFGAAAGLGTAVLDAARILTKSQAAKVDLQPLMVLVKMNANERFIIEPLKEAEVAARRLGDYLYDWSR